MAQFAVVIYSDDSGRVAGAETSADDENDRHADELATSGAMTLAYAFTSRSATGGVEVRPIHSGGPIL